MKKKKIPLRKCLGCNEHKTKRELIRIVKNNQDEIFIDITGKANGRGAYICPEMDCLIKAEKRDALSKAFQQKIDKEIYQSLRQEMEKKAPEAKQNALLNKDEDDEDDES